MTSSSAHERLHAVASRCRRARTWAARVAGAGRVLALGTLLLGAAGPAAAASVRVGGAAGFGITALRTPGAFRWDFDSLHEDTTLAVLHLGAQAASLRGFVALGARLEDRGQDVGARFELREAALTSSHHRATGDSLGLRLFAREPQSLWIDHALTPPVTAWAAGGEDATGARADVAYKAASATMLAGWRSALFAPDPALQANTAAWAPPAEDYFVLRARGDALHWAGLRVGATWKRVNPEVTTDAGASPPDVLHYDVVGLDTRFAWRGILGSVEYTHSATAVAYGDGPVAPPAVHRSAGVVTRALAPEDALRAELRCAGLPLGRWGALGFAPQYRALGTAYEDPLAASEIDPGRPRRGLEGYRLEAWYTPGTWPGWIRQTYDRHQQFRDTDRRVIAQTTEVQAQLGARLQVRTLYVQRDERLAERQLHEHHDNLLVELIADDASVHARVQAGAVDVGAPTERRLAALEAAAHLGRRLQAVARTACAAGQSGVRQSAWVELQYWHLPQFELAVQYGPEWIGDASDPIFDSDLTAGGRQIERFRLHFRGWF
jgi:hypothetical protein